MRRFLAALSLCLIAFGLSIGIADAKPRHAAKPFIDCFTDGPVMRCGGFGIDVTGQPSATGFVQQSSVRAVKEKKTRHAKKTSKREYRSIASHSGFSSGGYLVSKARAYMGQTASQIGLHRSTLWCSAFMRHITGASGVDDRARSWLVKTRVAPQVGAIAVLTRGKSGGHVGVVSGFSARGNPIIVSGNHGRRVGEGEYPRHRVLAYVMP